MSYNEFFVGQKVICISGPLVENPKRLKQPEIGEIYTIKELIPPQPFAKFPTIPACKLAEIQGDFFKNSAGKTLEVSFYLSRFRPLVSTNIDIFKEMCEDPEKFSYLENA